MWCDMWQTGGPSPPCMCIWYELRPCVCANSGASVDWTLTATNLCSYALVSHSETRWCPANKLWDTVRGCLSTHSRSRCKYELLVEPAEEYTYIDSSTPFTAQPRHPTNMNTPQAWHTNTQSHTYIHTGHTPAQPANLGPPQFTPITPNQHTCSSWVCLRRRSLPSHRLLACCFCHCRLARLSCCSFPACLLCLNFRPDLVADEVQEVGQSTLVSWSGWSWAFAPVPRGAGGAVVPLDAHVNGRVELHPEVCCPLVPREAGGAVDPLDARVDGRVELRPEVCCSLGHPWFSSNQRSVAMAAQRWPAKC